MKFLILCLSLISLDTFAREAVAENSIMVIKPYISEGTWVFDDASRKLVKEPFVAGIPAILNALSADIKDAKKGFRLTFSATPFPSTELTLVRLNKEHGGYWYKVENTEKKGWLCPAMFKYFKEAPEKIYVKADQMTDQQ